MKKFFGRLFGKYLAGKIDLQGGEMDDKKSWYKSKTVLTGIVTTLVGLYGLVDVNLGPQFGFDLPGIPEWVFAVLGGLGIYGRVVADKKIG